MAKVGGPRPGAGRKPGSKNKLTLERERALQETSEKITSILGEGAFEGDAHAFLVAVYKNPDLPVTLRTDAAKAAAPYEKPKLQSISHTLGNPSPETGETAAERRARITAEVNAILQPVPQPETPSLHIVKGSAQ